MPYGFLTTAHAAGGNYSVSVGDIFKIEDYYTKEEANLGQVSDVKYGLDFDMTLIPYNVQNFQAVATSTTRHNLPIESSESPEEDKTVYILRSNGSMAEAKVTETNFSDIWNTKALGFRNLIRFEFTTNKIPEGGDSGAAVCEISKDGKSFIIVGIYKGRDSQGFGVATRFDLIQDEYDVVVYTK